MAIQILMSADVLARSRFAISPIQEITDTLSARSARPARHTTAWLRRAAQGMSPGSLDLLNALVPTDHPYSPDFLTPAPERPAQSAHDLAERVAGTPAEIVEYHLDIGLADRPVRAEVAEQFPSRAEYEAWRRPMPPLLAGLAGNPRRLAEAAASALLEFFQVAVEQDWPAVRSVLQDDIRYRADVMAGSGAAELLRELDPGLVWTGDGIRLERPFSGIVDWADDGLLFVPSTAHVGVARFSAERPATPMVSYRSRGIAALWETPAGTDADSALGELLGSTRAVLLQLLATPRSTTQLSRESGWSEATVSYHLGILSRGRLVSRQRRGKLVLYERTDLGSKLADTVTK